MAGNTHAKNSAQGEPLPGLPLWLSRDWVWGLILFLAVVLVYTPAWWAGFVWDDDAFIATNPCIVGPFGLKEIWTTTAADICPLTLTTFWLEHALWGLTPLPYHLVNVCLHGAGAIGLWRVLRALNIPGAWLGAALWALHPVAVESVAWVSEMKNTQSGLFYLLTILFFIKGLKNPGRWTYGVSLLFAALAMTSKSSTVILPVVLGLCAWWVEGRLTWRSMARTGPFFLMSAMVAVVSVWTQKAHDFNWMVERSRSWPERLATVGDAVWFYLGKLVWPRPLIIVYPRWQIDPAQLISYLPLVAVILLAILLWFKRQTWARAPFFAFAYFLAALLPVLGLLNLNYFHYSFVADHFQYLASMGPLALVGAGLFQLSKRILPPKAEWQAATGAGLLLMAGVLSWRQARTYENDVTLWNHTLAWDANSWVSYSNLGLLAAQQGQTEKAIDLYQKALTLNPDYLDAHNNLGVLFFRQGKADEAMAQYAKVLEIYPNSAQAHNNLSTVLAHEGRIDEAMAELQKTLAVKSEDADAHYNLGLLLAQKGRWNEAIDQYQKAVDLNPNYRTALNQRGEALFNEGQVDAAIAQYEMTMKLHPASAQTHNDLGLALVNKSQLDEAIEHFRKAVEIDPNYADAHHNLGTALYQKGQANEAMAEWQSALKINPDDIVARDYLGVCLAKNGKLESAIEQFKEALRLNPDDRSAQDNLVQAQALLPQKAAKP